MSSLLLGGCIGMLSARGPSVDGVWQGKVVSIVLITVEGKPVTVLGFRPESGTDHPIWSGDAVLVNRDNQVCDLDQSLLGHEVRVRGNMQGRVIYSRDGIRLVYEKKSAGVDTIQTKGGIERLD